MPLLLFLKLEVQMKVSSKRLKFRKCPNANKKRQTMLPRSRLYVNKCINYKIKNLLQYVLRPILFSIFKLKTKATVNVLIIRCR